MVAALKKSKGAVKKKMGRLGLEVVVQDKKFSKTTTSFDLPVPDDLPLIKVKVLST